MIKFHHSRILAALLFLYPSLTLSALGQEAMGLQISVSPSQATPIELSLEDMDALEQVTFSTTTIWTDGETTFSGVPLKALLAHVEAKGAGIEMVALNAYAVSMPVSELEDDAPIVATRMNGETMSVREKGPFWVVFPYDRDPKYRTETVYSRSIWQLNRLKLLENE